MSNRITTWNIKQIPKDEVPRKNINKKEIKSSQEYKNRQRNGQCRINTLRKGKQK